MAKKKLYIVNIENNHTGGYFVGGVFDNKKDMNKFIKEEKLGKVDDFEIKEVILNEPLYELFDGDDE